MYTRKQRGCDNALSGQQIRRQYYSEQLSQNVRRGVKTSAQKGRYTGGTCPLGYTIDENKRYVIDPKHAPTVREIFQLYSEGKTVTEIITILNNKGLRTAKGQPFTHNSLRTLLKNKKYIGNLLRLDLAQQG